MNRVRPVIRSSLLALAVVATTLGSAAAESDPVPVGAEFQVNTVTDGSQLEASVAALGETGFFTARVSRSGPGGFMARVWTSAGVANGHEFDIVPQPNGFTEGHPDVAALPDGGVVVVWDADDLVGSSDLEVKGRIFDSLGRPVGSDFAVNSVTTSVQDQPAVAASAAGDFVVTWRNYDGAVIARRFSSIGAPLGVEASLREQPCSQSLPDVVAKPTGGFVTVWRSGFCDATPEAVSVNLRQLDASAVPVGAELVVSAPDDYFVGGVSVAAQTDGRMLVVWNEIPTPQPEMAIRAREIAADGSPVGARFRISEPEVLRSSYPQVVAGPTSGSFFVTWVGGEPSLPESYPGSDGSGTSVDGRMVRLEHGPSDQLIVNAFTTSNQFGPALAVARSGHFMAIWSSVGGVGDDASGTAIEGRIFRDALVHRDGFERGDLSGWSTSVPW